MDLPPVAVRNEDGFYSCVKCSKKYSSKSATIRHYRNHTGEHPYVCSLCQEMFTSKSSLSTHQLRAHNLNREFALPCAHCGKLFMRRFSLDVHLKIHDSQKSFSCDHCGKSFTQKVTRDIHMTQHTGKYNYECAACRKTFASRAKLNSHSAVHESPRFTCERCGRRFVRHDSLRVHLRIHMRTHLLTTPCAAAGRERSLQCCRCSLVLPTLSELQLHKQTHKEAVSCECMWCNADLEGAALEDGRLKNTSCCKAFEDKISSPSDETPLNPNSSLISNTLLANLEEQKPTSAEDLFSQQCVTFPPNTANQEKKNIEMARKERFYSCHMCPKSFAYKNKLSAHIKTHLQEPTHECDICCKRFYRIDVCARHRLLHRNQRPFLCAHCGKSFITKFSLSAHLKTHSPSKEDSSLGTEFQCDGCGKKFKHKSTFNLHRRAHAGEVQHECLMCRKKFMKRSHLEGHVRSHCTDRPFNCTSCGRRFKERKHCREHSQKAHARPLASLLERSAEKGATSVTVASSSSPSSSSSSSCPNSSSQPSPSHLLSGASLLNAVGIEESVVSSLQAPEIPQELPSALICNAIENNSSALHATYLIRSPVHLPETSIVMTTPISGLVLSNLEPILQENRIPEVNQFLSKDGRSDLDKTNVFHLGSQNDPLTFSVLSDDETRSVFSQGME